MGGQRGVEKPGPAYDRTVWPIKRLKRRRFMGRIVCTTPHWQSGIFRPKLIRACTGRIAVWPRKVYLFQEAAMSIPSNLANYLDQRGARYEVFAHAHSRTSAETARSANVMPSHLAKSVVLEDDLGYV